MNQIRKRLTYANVMSSIAVFLILGGATALAAGKLGKNSVGAKQIKNNAVTSAKIKKGAVTGAKVANGTLTGTQINASTLGTVPNATTAANANTLGGNLPTVFERSSNLLSAVVTNNGTAATLVRGTSGVSVERYTIGDVIVTFPRDVSTCTWVASVGQPGNEIVSPGIATVRGGEQPTQVKVVTWKATTEAQTDFNFHLIVLC